MYSGKRVWLRQRYRGCLTGFSVPLLPKPHLSADQAHVALERQRHRKERRGYTS